jgi:hypothetical protein
MFNVHSWWVFSWVGITWAGIWGEGFSWVLICEGHQG